MPRQNRVDPTGAIIASPERGLFMGNRGVLHDDEGRIKRAWQVKRWIICLLEFRGRKRTLMTPGHYTELFFLDEATALAAGHRPCAECRRDRFNAFCAAWQVAHGVGERPHRPTATDIDNRLHADRLGLDHTKGVFEANLRELPNGVFVTSGFWRLNAYLVWNDSLLAWSAGGYSKRLDRPEIVVSVLTPKSTVAAVRAGYMPEIHPSAHELTR